MAMGVTAGSFARYRDSPRNGQALNRLVVMDNDIHERKEIEDTLIQAAEGLSSVSGDDFLPGPDASLSSILGTRDNLVCYCVGDPRRARARWPIIRTAHSSKTSNMTWRAPPVELSSTAGK
jgi:hypothetical protein